MAEARSKNEAHRPRERSIDLQEPLGPTLLPRFRQRVLILLTVALALIGWHLVRRPIQPPNLSTGLALTDAYAGVVGATLMVILGAMPAVVMALACSTHGHALSGLFGVTAGLTIFAWAGGPIDGWMRRVELPGAYGLLIFEMLLWQALVLLLGFAIHRLRPVLAAQWPDLAYDDPLEPEPDPAHKLYSATACLASALIAGLVGWIFIRNSDPAQVMLSLILGFTLGGMLPPLMLPGIHALGVLLSPTLLAVAVYGLVLTTYPNEAALLQDWYGSQLFGPAMALPIHYISAGTASVIAGYTWGRAIRRELDQPGG